MFEACINWLRRLFQGRMPNESLFHAFVLESRSEAQQSIQREGAIAIVTSGGTPKWLMMKCPCRCGQMLALNLMASHSPHWRVAMPDPLRVTVFPSVDS